MKSLAVLSLFVSVALAQSSPSNALIPEGISAGCEAFYNQLNANTDLSTCLQPIISVTAPLDASSSPPTSSAITTALEAICSAPNTCTASSLGPILTQFQQACQPELTTSKNSAVVLLYDSIYVIAPFKSAACEKDTSGNYCMADDSSNSTKRASLDRRDDSQEVFVPDAAVFAQDNVLFLGISPSLAANELCVPCTRQVMNDYTNQLSSYPYAPGISNSVLLAGQSALYTAITQKCGDSFLGGQVQAAGGLATGAAPRSVDSGFTLVSSAIVAAAVGAVTLL